MLLFTAQCTFLCSCVGICAEFAQLTTFALEGFASCLFVSLVALLYDTRLVPSWVQSSLRAAHSAVTKMM